MIKIIKQKDEHYSYLMIFSYINRTDVNFNLIEHLLETNETISSININLFDYVKIENNFFGYVLKRIKILSIPEKITITSCLNGNEINSNSFLTENENISISVSLENQTINEKYIIEYALTLSNPDYINLNDYIIDIDKTYGDSKEGNFYNIEEYIGRTSFLKLLKIIFYQQIVKMKNAYYVIKIIIILIILLEIIFIMIIIIIILIIIIIMIFKIIIIIILVIFVSHAKKNLLFQMEIKFAKFLICQLYH